MPRTFGSPHWVARLVPAGNQSLGDMGMRGRIVAGDLSCDRHQFRLPSSHKHRRPVQFHRHMPVARRRRLRRAPVSVTSTVSPMEFWLALRRPDLCVFHSKACISRLNDDVSWIVVVRFGMRGPARLGRDFHSIDLGGLLAVHIDYVCRSGYSMYRQSRSVTEE